MFFAITALITGAAAVQNLLTIENPVGSSKRIFIGKIAVSGVSNAVATTKFAYSLGRATALPTVGTILTAQKRITVDPAPVAVCRSLPTATAAAGGIATVMAGVQATNVGANNPQYYELYQANEENQLVLLENEALIVIAGVNTTGWSHVAQVEWNEV